MPPRGYEKKVVSHQCQYCTYVTHRRSFMNDHLRVHTGEKPFSCETCGKSFSQKSNLRQHLKVHNQGNNASYGCDKCDFKTKWKSSLQVHERMHKGEKPYKCKICDRAFSQSTHCQTHMREAHLNMRRFQCDVCSKTFKRSEHLERHMAFHKEERNFECDICHKKYLDARYLKQHTLIHEGEASKIHQCSVCPYRSRYKQGLKIHERIHTGVRPFECEQCGKSFVTRQSYKLHYRMVHQGVAGKIFKCDQCNFSTANKQNLKGHILKIHLKVKNNGPHQCMFCSLVLRTRLGLQNHLVRAHGSKIKLEHKVLLQTASPMKVIGSISPKASDVEAYIKSKYKPLLMRSPRRQLHFDAPSNRVEIKAEIRDEGSNNPTEVSEKQTICEDISPPLDGNTSETKGIANGIDMNRNGVKRNGGGNLSADFIKDHEVTETESEEILVMDEAPAGLPLLHRIDKSVIQRKSPIQSGRSPTRAKSPKRSLQDFVRIKLSQKSKLQNKESTKRAKSPKSPIKSGNGVNTSPSGITKSPVPSSKRARALFVNPQVYVDKGTTTPQIGDKLLVQNNEPVIVEISEPLSSVNNNVYVNKVVGAEKQYDSLRAIASELFSCPQEFATKQGYQSYQSNDTSLLNSAEVKVEPIDYSTRVAGWRSLAGESYDEPLDMSFVKREPNML